MAVAGRLRERPGRKVTEKVLEEGGSGVGERQDKGEVNCGAVVYDSMAGWQMAEEVAMVVTVTERDKGGGEMGMDVVRGTMHKQIDDGESGVMWRVVTAAWWWSGSGYEALR